MFSKNVESSIFMMLSTFCIGMIMFPLANFSNEVEFDMVNHERSFQFRNLFSQHHEYVVSSINKILCSFRFIFHLSNHGSPVSL